MAIKQKSMPIFIILALLSIAISSSISGIDMGDKSNRLFIDTTVFIQTSILTVIAIFFSLNYLEKELKNGLFLIPLSSGIDRKEYFLSVVLSKTAILISLFSIFFIFDFVYIFIFHIDKNLLVQLFLGLLSSSILVILIISIGQYTSSLKALIYSIILYFIGNGLDELFIYSYKLEPNEILQNLYEILSKIVPNFYIFGENEISFFHILHFVTIFAILYLVGFLKFQNKVLKIED
jgi:hypothetical protein